MAIKRPDIYEHNNSLYPIVDITNVLGGMFIMSGSSDTERFNIPQTKLKEKQLVKNTIGELWELVDITQSDNSNGWELFATMSGLTGDTYIISASTNTDTLYLTRNDGAVISTPLTPAMSGAVLYTNSNPTYVDVGGVEQGSTFSAVTMQDMWTDLLYPNLNPSFTSFIMSGYSANVDVGYTLSAGSKTWTWSTNNTSFIQPDTVKITDITNSIVLITDLTNDGVEIVSTPTDITKTSRLSHRWDVSAQKMNNTWFSRRYYMNWYWRRYWGESTNPSLDTNGLTGLTGYVGGELSRLITGDFEFPANNSYKYLVIPKSSGWIPVAGNPNHYWYHKEPEYVRDISTNLNIALAGPSEGYNDTINGLSYKSVTITNSYGFDEEYYVFRTKYMLGGSIIITIQ